MKIAMLLGQMSLGARDAVDLPNFRTTPGMTGTDTGFVRIGEELEAMGHTVERFYPSKMPTGRFDLALAVNEPDLLRGVDAGFRVALTWLNDWTFCKAGFDSFVDLYCSPSAAHMEKFRTDPKWHRVQTDPSHPDGHETFVFKPEKWCAIELGCDPWRYGADLGDCTHEHDEDCGGDPPRHCEHVCDACDIDRAKHPGRVVHCSSPDRGLHWLLQEWPVIKLAVPHATLHIFYRIEPWIRGFDGTPYFPPIEPNRARALYVQEALKRLSDPKWGITLRDSVSRETIEREMAQAEVMAYPCDTLAWSEGFSCSVLEGCAARACPITTDCDALGQVYGDHLPLVKRNGRDPREWVPEWRKAVIGALQDASYRDHVNKKARAFSETRTWRRVAEEVMREVEKRKAA